MITWCYFISTVKYFLYILTPSQQAGIARLVILFLIFLSVKYFNNIVNRFISNIFNYNTGVFKNFWTPVVSVILFREEIVVTIFFIGYVTVIRNHSAKFTKIYDVSKLINSLILVLRIRFADCQSRKIRSRQYSNQSILLDSSHGAYERS